MMKFFTIVGIAVCSLIAIFFLLLLFAICASVFQNLRDGIKGPDGARES